MDNELVVVACRYTDAEAHLAKHALELEGVQCILRNEYLQGICEINVPIELLVRAEDVGKAHAILEAPKAVPEDQPTKGESICCPECGSGSTELTWRPPTGYSARVFGALRRDAERAKFRCFTCGKEFEARL
jgi:DNA-directed RNA polymerase subunit RPC12/RpoP